MAVMYDPECGNAKRAHVACRGAVGITVLCMMVIHRIARCV